jgi:hypothetical protein
VKVVVAPQIRPVHEGTVYRPGEVVELPMPIAYQWVGSGWAVEAIDAGRLMQQPSLFAALPDGAIHGTKTSARWKPTRRSNRRGHARGPRK